MNDPQCIRLESEPASSDQHGTTVIIIAETQEGRLHPLVNDAEQMRAVLYEGCACRLPENPATDPQHGLYQSVSNLTKDIAVSLPRLIFQGTELYKTYPGNLQAYTTETIEMEVGGQRHVLAKVWYATNQENERLDGPAAGIRVMRDGFPIGKRNLDSDRDIIGSELQITRQDLLDWHVGEVHLLDNELRPDASGEGLPDSVLYKYFRERLRGIYSRLIEKSYAKQRTKTLRSDYKKDATFLASLKRKVELGENVTTEEVQRAESVAKKVQADNNLARGQLAAGTSPGDKKAYVRDDEAVKLRRKLGSVLRVLKPHFPSSPLTSNGPTSPGGKKPKNKEQTSRPKPDGQPNTAAADVTAFLSLIDEIRDAVTEVLQDDETLQNELLGRINQIVSTLGR
jgi:hypothetical protein